MARLEKAGTNFTQVSNIILNDKSLSAKAKGIYSYLYSKPDNWSFAYNRIANDFSDGEKSILSGLKELEYFGYLERKKQGDGSTIYYLGIKPTAENRHLDTDPTAENGYLPFGQVAEIGTISNTDITTNTELVSNTNTLTGSEAPEEEKEFGNPDINKTLAFLRKVVGVDSFKNSEEWQRRYAHHFVSLVSGTKKKEGIGKDEFLHRLQSILADKYKSQRCNDIQFLYEEVKAFIHSPAIIPNTHKKGTAQA